MKGKYQKIAGAFVLGILIPFLVFQLSAMVRAGKVSETEPEGQTQSDVLLPTQPATEPEALVSVYMSKGEAVQMPMDEYLVGVILAEMSTDYEMAALQAQAVAARTYAQRRAEEGRHPNGGICTDSGCCQAYVSVAAYLDGLGYPIDVERAQQAANSTHGQVLTYQGKCIEATYFSCAGGKTEDAVAVWGVLYPYLRSVDSPEGEDKHHMVRKEFSEEVLEEKLGRVLYGDPEGWIGWTTYTEGGGVNTVFFAGQRYHGTEFRSLLGLASTSFSLEATEDGIAVITCGKGHRVGMSQCGAQVLALGGNTYQEILLHYYPGAEIGNWDALGTG